MKTLYVDERINYTGEELRAHWIYSRFGILGDAVVAFKGEVNVPRDKMIDISEVKENSYIYSPLMLNFIIEHFCNDLDLGIYRQRLFMVCILEELLQHSVPATRRGDNIYIHKNKLSVSIATATTVSTLIHVGLNIESAGTPVDTSGLTELGIQDISSLAENIMLRYIRELEQINDARCKVRAV
ncbi:DUF366 family protein [Syntrophomonas palmitatica]|uniref:DUF366 family protein n=1 Tax=Syntrophomonas palmitatica TaxID=402877 RepID=UPI0006D27D2A|nr:DUF366 family protein [Syntrophomonas palmitatica]